MKPSNPPEIAVVLVNLGTPDAPTEAAVRRYLKQFLSDPRVIEIPQFIWQIILNLFVLRSRPKRVAHAYASVWDGDSHCVKSRLPKWTCCSSDLTNINCLAK